MRDFDRAEQEGRCYPSGEAGVSPTSRSRTACRRHAGRLPVEVVIEAEASLRGVRYPRHVETAAWYLLSEALTNAVKHSGAGQVTVGLAQPSGRLVVEVRDDGRGFDPAAARGLGLSGLADRMSIVHLKITQ